MHEAINPEPAFMNSWDSFLNNLVRAAEWKATLVENHQNALSLVEIFHDVANDLRQSRTSLRNNIFDERCNDAFYLRTLGYLQREFVYFNELVAQATAPNAPPDIRRADDVIGAGKDVKGSFEAIITNETLKRILKIANEILSLLRLCV